MVECWTPAQYVWVNLAHSAAWALCAALGGAVFYYVRTRLKKQRDREMLERAAAEAAEPVRFITLVVAGRGLMALDNRGRLWEGWATKDAPPSPVDDAPTGMTWRLSGLPSVTK